MRIHHFYPRTKNIGDHFVQAGIQALVQSINSEATFEVFDVNSRGSSREEYGLTRVAIEKANREANLIIVGGSNLYEGAFGWPWGVHLDRDALRDLRVPLFLIGVGTGSAFASPIHHPSNRAITEIKLLNEVAAFSWARDVTTSEWLRELGITKAEMLGDPATFIFNSPYRASPGDGYVLIVVPPLRIWASRRGFLKSARLGRPVFRALVVVAQQLINARNRVVIACNDPRELEFANELFKQVRIEAVVCPGNKEEYFQLLSEGRTVISGRLHTAAVALSMGLPFLLFDLDHRTRGFIETYELTHASVALSEIRHGLEDKVGKLLDAHSGHAWRNSIRVRDSLYRKASERLKNELERVASKC